MSSSAIEVGDKVHIITRRIFEGDIRRHFVGEVTGVSFGLQEVTGYVFVFHSGTSEYERRPELRVRVFSLGQSGFIVNKIPREVDIGSLRYRVIDKHLVVTDSGDFKLDIHEFGPFS